MAKKNSNSVRKPFQPALETDALDSSAEFEKLLKSAAGGSHYVLKLYVAGSTLRSAQAIASIRSLCDEHLAGHHDLEVIDIYQQPEEASREQIIAAPTLVKEYPKPLRRMVGDLCDRNRVLVGLNLQAVANTAPPHGKTKWAEL